MSDYVGYDDALRGDDLEGDDYVGADDAEILGAVRRARARRAAGGGGRALQAQRPQLSAQASAPKLLRGYLGLGTATFVNGGPTTATLTVEPQRSFRPERLIIDRVDTGAGAPGLATTVTAIYIGDQPQSPSVEQPAPTAMFRPDATVSGIDFDKAVPGQKIQINLAISAAPAASEVVRLSCGMFGDMMR